MKVSELIEHLKQFHPDLLVYTKDDGFKNSFGELGLEEVYKTRLRDGFPCEEPGVSHEAVII